MCAAVALASASVSSKRVTRQARTRPVYDAPTTTGAIRTRAGCFPSSQNRFFPALRAQILCARHEPRQSLVLPELRHLHTIGPSARVQSARLTGHHGGPHAGYPQPHQARQCCPALRSAFCARQTVQPLIPLRHILIQGGMLIKDVQQFQIMAATNLKVIEIMCRGDFSPPQDPFSISE